MLKTGKGWQEETFKIEKSKGCQGSFFVFSIFVFYAERKPCLRSFLIFHLNGNYVIRIGTRQDRYVSMREFSNHAVLSISDSTMTVSSKYTQDLSV